jgi:hypothetical protein
MNENIMSLTMAEPLKQIAARRAEVERLMTEHRNALLRLETEDAELEVAQRVVQRLGTGGAADDDQEPDLPPPSAYAGKPPGTPTVPEMILEVLSERRKDGVLLGMEPKGLAEVIAKKWWPKVSATEISPIAWRMAKRGQLEKDGTYYSLPPLQALINTIIGSAPGKPDNH